ncbi:hypothetical protein AB0C52_12470 [Streptomyces sp. NPDC048717]|uniref:hypothetical protein n=1 Tax=Streptomyces sp. NPDC048717 TaxID=3154928 RepID=UPI00344A86C5
MSEPRRIRGAKQLLLLTALLFGLVTMHTLGHGPTGHDASALARMAAPAAAGQEPGTAGHSHHGLARGATADTEADSVVHSPNAPNAPVAQAAPAAVNAAPHPHHSMPPAHGDGGPLAVCLAVLGALVVVLGGAALLRASRRAGRLGAGPTGVRWIAWPQPPPGLAILDRVAVLRI